MADISPSFAQLAAEMARASLATTQRAELAVDAEADDAITLERVFADPRYMGIPASPLQLAVTRLASGDPMQGVLTEEECAAHLGAASVTAAELRRIVLICGIRGGKSTLGIAHAITSCLTANLSTLKPHEVPRYPIIGPTVDAATATYRQLIGYLQTSAELERYVDGEPTANAVMIRRPDGRRVELVVVAAHRGGLSVRNRWLVGITLEEVASFGSESTGAAVNAEEILRAAETRLLPGCQSWLISSPFGPVGLLYDLYRRHFGKSSSTLVVHAPTRALNPSFPQATIDEIAREDPDTAAREYGAEWVDADSAFLEATLIDDAQRDAPMVVHGKALVAAIDPATRGNAWTLTVAKAIEVRDIDVELEPGAAVQVVRRVIVCGVWQWVGSKKVPLKPKEVFREIANILAPFGVKKVWSDGWSLDALAGHAATAGLTLLQFEAKGANPYATLKTLLSNRLLELPPDDVMRQDLLAIRKRATANGVSIYLPVTADGRHCDYAPSVALAAHLAEQTREAKFSYDSAPDPRHATTGAGDFRRDISRGVWNDDDETPARAARPNKKWGL